MELEQGISLEEALQAFDFGAAPDQVERYGSGHINDTFLVVAGGVRFILQRINTHVFKKPEQVMANIVGVTEYLKQEIQKHGGDVARETLNVRKSKDGGRYFTDSQQQVWRCYDFITGTVCLQQVEKPEDFYQAAKSFGTFLRLLGDYPAGTLYETIAKFHDTRDRFHNFEIALQEDICGRAHLVQEEIRFVLARKADCGYLMDKLERGELPLRVTHNDTKLNNILFDEKTGEGLCIIDLDTIMPGLVLNDFGDSIRFGASTAAEDEPDLSRVRFDLNLFEVYTKGYCEAAGDVLTREEKKCMPWGAKLMTLECGIRFLTDYLQGDPYFKIHRENHNLDRCRTQFKLVSDMESEWYRMNEIVEKYS